MGTFHLFFPASKPRISRVLPSLSSRMEMAFHNPKCHCIMDYMTTTLTIDKAGRVVLPKPVRDEMQLRAGDSLELESSEDRIVLRPRRGGVGLHQKQGIWVFGVGEQIPAGAT